MKINQVITEKSVSQQQQKFMGMVYAAKKGEKPASPAVAKAAAGMSKSDAKDFAKTKHKGLPKKVEEATGDPLGTVSTAPDASGKVKIKTPTGTEIETTKDALLPGAKPGTVQMKPDAAGDALKPGTQVVSAEAMDDDLGRIKSLAGMKEQDPNPAPGAPAPQAAAPTQQLTPKTAPPAAEDDDGPVPPIESKEDFVKFFLERNPEYTKPENKAMLDKLVAVDTDGTVDLEVTMANMMKIFANELAPGFVEMFEHLSRIIEEAISDPEFAQLTPQEQTDLKDALVDIKKKLPEMKQTVTNIQAQAPELDAVVAQRKLAGMKNFGMPKASIQQPAAPAPAASMEELGRIKELAGLQ